MEIEIQDLLGVGVVGVLLSTLIDSIKTRFGTTSNYTKILTVALAVIIGTLYYFFRGTPYWATLVAILAISQTIYAFFLR